MLNSHHPFVGHKELFSAVPLDQRSAYIVKMLQTPQESEPIKLHREEYPHEDSLPYKQYRLHYYSTQPVDQPSVVLFYIHGLNSHGGNSAYMGLKIAQVIPNSMVYAIDFLNFGKSNGDYKGYIQSFEELISQAEAFVDHVLAKYQTKPKTFLIGGSLGGTISFRMTLLKPGKYDGVIFLVPGLREVKQSQYIMKKVGKAIGYFFPKLKLTEQSHSDSTRFQMIDTVKNNDLNYNGRHIPGSVRVALNAMEETEKLYSEFNTPYICFQSGVDKLVDPFAPIDLEAACKTADKTTIYMKDMWHSIFYEDEIKHVVELAIEWLLLRI